MNSDDYKDFPHILLIKTINMSHQVNDLAYSKLMMHVIKHHKNDCLGKSHPLIA